MKYSNTHLYSHETVPLNCSYLLILGGLFYLTLSILFIPSAPLFSSYSNGSPSFLAPPFSCYSNGSPSFLAPSFSPTPKVSHISMQHPILLLLQRIPMLSFASFLLLIQRFPIPSCPALFLVLLQRFPMDSCTTSLAVLALTRGPSPHFAHSPGLELQQTFLEVRRKFEQEEESFPGVAARNNGPNNNNNKGKEGGGRNQPFQLNSWQANTGLGISLTNSTADSPIQG